MANGSLYDVLQDGGAGGPGVALVPSWSVRAGLLADTARGMAALHACLPRAIIHRDLKSMNVLIFKVPGRMVAKIADFGEPTTDAD